jgi:glutaredoxin
MEEKKAESKKAAKPHKRNVWKIYTFILALVSITLIVNSSLHPTGQVITQPEQSLNVLSSDDAAKKALDYINTYVLQGQATAILVETIEESGLYDMKIRVMGRVYDSYVTKDGKLLMLSALDLNKKPEVPEQQQPTQFDAPDAEKPNVKFFVMSFCPFGNQAEDGLAPVFKLLGDEKVEWEPHYVIYSNYRGGGPQYCLDKENKYCSMHGIQELNEDVRELCIWKYYDHTVWWDFVLKINGQCNSGNADTCWEPIAKEFGIDVDKINTCVKEQAEDLLAAEAKLNKQYGIQGSPTVLINDKQYSGGRNAENFKEGICSGFVSQPDECSKTLGATSSEASGGCG